MSQQQTQLEKVLAENAILYERIANLEKDIAKQEYRQGLKERPFWIEMPSLWFCIVEAEFKVTGVSDDYTKYNYVVSQLDKEVLEKVKDIVEKPPLRSKYLKIKEELIRRFDEPEHERMKRLFTETLGDKKPSEFYRHLRNIAGTNITVDKILLHLWLRRLPQYCQEILASRSEQTNLKLAELADNIMEATKVSGKSQLNNTVMDNLQQCIDELSKQMVTLRGAVKRQKSRSRSRSTSMPRSRSATPSSPKICWYHTQWGADAYRCIPPCSWKKPEKAED